MKNVKKNLMKISQRGLDSSDELEIGNLLIIIEL